jgi:hypothetical protein
MSSDSKPAQESSTLKPPKWIAAWTAGTLSLIAVALLQRFGDSVFDTLQSALGKRLVVQAIALLLVLLGYCVWLLLRRPRIRRLERRFGLYWASDDKTAFCPFCYETSDKQLHLVGPKDLRGSEEKLWECNTCYHWYRGKPESDVSTIETPLAVELIRKGKR